MPQEDADIAQVEAVLNGDSSAFDDLVLKYQRAMASLVIRMNGYNADVADTVQKIFVKAFSKLRTFKRQSTFKTWLYSIGINTCRNELRRITRARKEDDIEDVQLTSSDDMEDDLLAQQRRRQLKVALKELPDRQRETVTLRIYQELSFRDIGRMLDISENSAKVNFHHGMKRLREIVAD